MVRIEPVLSAYPSSVANAETALSEAPELYAPDLIEPVVAFRTWRAIEGRLRSPYIPVFWDERVLPARCRRGERADDGVDAPHRPPHPGCVCGVHAYHEPDLAFPTVDYQGVAGIVSVWGRVEVADEGLRAEFARVEALGTYSRWSRRQKQNIAEVAASLGIDLIDMNELAGAASGYGSHIVPGSLDEETVELERAFATRR
jgi:hypothetical protein